MAELPDHKAAASFAAKAIEDENLDVRNLARAYVEAVLELKSLSDLLDKLGSSLGRAKNAGPVSIADYLDLSSSRSTVHDRMRKRKRKKK